MAQQNQAEKPKFMCSSAAFEVLQQCLHQKVDDRSKAQLDSGQVKAKKKKKRKEKAPRAAQSVSVKHGMKIEELRSQFLRPLEKKSDPF